MSCQVQLKSRSTGAKPRGNPIHRTTSETIRLSESDKILNNPSARQILTISPPLRKPASCSFQITGVSLTNFGEDSADELELDESYTDDISRVTDNETPSYSEETFSRDVNSEVVISNISSMTAALTVTSEKESEAKATPNSFSTDSIVVLDKVIIQKLFFYCSTAFRLLL